MRTDEGTLEAIILNQSLMQAALVKIKTAPSSTVGPGHPEQSEALAPHEDTGCQHAVTTSHNTRPQCTGDQYYKQHVLQAVMTQFCFLASVDSPG